MSKKVSPVRKQYLQVKRLHPNEIVFFRLGDFYETFDEDAEITSRELDIVLTSRNVGKGARVPMAGIPHHAAQNYIARLIDKGFHVAICEQVGDGPEKGLFPREVVRVITPGTVVEPTLLPGDANNYLAAVLIEEGMVAVAYTDVSTGEFATTQFKADDTIAAARYEIARLRPAEVLVPESLDLNSGDDLHLTRLPDWRFESARSEDHLKQHFKTITLDGFGMGDKPLAVRTAGVIVDYLDSTQPAVLDLLDGLSLYSLDEFMILDAATRRNLELSETIRTGEVRGSLLGIIDETVTPMGRRLLRHWISRPLRDIQQIGQRLDQIETFFSDGLWRAEVRNGLNSLGDLERLTNRIAAGMAGPRDLAALRTLLQNLPTVCNLMEKYETGPLDSIINHLDPCSEVDGLLKEAITDDPPATLAHIGIIRPGYSRQLDSVFESSRKAREWIANLETIERKRTGIKSLKVSYNKVFGYYIEITKANIDRAPPEYIRKQTLINAERYITPEMKEYESLVLNAEERIREIEGELFRDICRQVGEQSHRLLNTARSLARLDVVAGLAKVAANKDYCRPEVMDDDSLEIREGRHPVVEEFLEGKRYVPNDTVLEPDERIRIITGPNMSGKSTYLRQVALIVLMAQMGSYVPARSARIGITDRIFTRIGARDEIHAGQSTFMVEMVEASNILHNATDRSLLILDEIGRGTSTYDGLSIAWAIVEYLHNHPKLRSRTLFATHYHELTRLAEVLPGVRNYNVAVSEEGGHVVFLHKIVPGGADKSYGIHVAELAGMPRPVINRAQEILSNMEDESRAVQARDENASRQLVLFPETNPLLDELDTLAIESITPLEALNKLYEWRQRFGDSGEQDKADKVVNS